MLHLSRRRRHGESKDRHRKHDGRNTRDRSHEAGFTLIELLVVMVILVLLASLVAPRVIGYLGSSRTKTAKVQIASLSTSLELFKLDTGRYPDAREGLSALVQRPSGVNAWNGPYLKIDRVPLDPWGQPYIYRFPGQHGAFDIISLGADKREGGAGEDQDVSTGD
ncbi:type II secretion system major pseudopilin GspG [Hyphomicrobium sp.]|uniref:type II secretion system major pseudopilin GspG n=1 Tax=Hyphomicrobium sp. TaxID=82 RepID=UPI001D446D03|nr:type II secretion system major pseudopilin GspG [Hyphomicrobium sp.]MBY0562351.1 type II secretion system major pseudopilin GspG [Hyphomicrobium sp.]